ncbi:MAG TPA: efflux RND transporter periplasmic adaptor subunit [Thermoanaerobaculia bacterium]|jgi:macrolide-specific efflux system membrane fusion protein|nr:efflux RND transporter periplasmic adaptor subunit [Thermoanaerobaculia bacterium]
MKKLVLGLLILGAIAIAVVVLARSGAPEGEERAGGAEVVRVSRRDLETVVTATGVIKPMIGAEVRVGSRASGVVSKLFVRIGDAVTKGQLLAELETRELAARRAQAAAALASAQADLDYARADLRRKRELGAAELIPRSDLDLAERACAVAEQQLKEAEANLEYATTQLGYTRIYAPIGGVVASISTQEGETVAASLAAPTFVTLLDLDRLEVWAYVDETDIGRIRAGQQASFTVDTYPGQEFAGRVTDVYPQAEIRDNVVNYVTVVRFQPPRDRTLRPEMTTTVRIALERRAGVLAVPRRAVRREGGRQFVLLTRGDAVERRWVRTGSQDEGYWEIVEGLREGDDVLVGNVKTE